MLFFPKYGTRGVEGVCAAATLAHPTRAAATNQPRATDGTNTGDGTRVRISSTSEVRTTRCFRGRPDGEALKTRSDLTVTGAEPAKAEPVASNGKPGTLGA